MEDLFSVVLAVICILAMAGDVGLFGLVFPLWHAAALSRGLATRRHQPWHLEVAGDLVRVHRSNRQPEAWPLSSVARARHAVNGNWTESKLLDDGLTLFDASGRALVKVAAACSGFSQLMDELERRHVPIQWVEVSAPAYLD